METEAQTALEAFARDVASGLRAPLKWIPPKYFYDETGSQLFEEITHQPEYYLTRTEAAILRRHAADIGSMLGDQLSLVELGSGSAAKTTILLESFLERQEGLLYLPIDISPTILEETAVTLDARYPALDVTAIPSEYGRGLHEANRILQSGAEGEARKLVLFLGSSIGNLEPDLAVAFLGRVAATLNESDGLLVGFDLQKEPAILNAAYNDAKGVTARFNLNVLARINRELGGEFDLDFFEHRAFYNQAAGRIEMHLASKRDHEVPIASLEETFAFTSGETIHTENSYKYTEDQIHRMGREAGLATGEIYMDDRRWFALSLFVPA